VQTLDSNAFLTALFAKAEEELAELRAEPSLEELADLLEVILALADLLGDRDSLELVRAKKHAERGGFEARVWLESVMD
jgi:predicted house-cleaning noncanonical NTP pyrophosphatase (MazG superfamily)